MVLIESGRGEQEETGRHVPNEQAITKYSEGSYESAPTTRTVLVGTTRILLTKRRNAERRLLTGWTDLNATWSSATESENRDAS